MLQSYLSLDHNGRHRQHDACAVRLACIQDRPQSTHLCVQAYPAIVGSNAGEHLDRQRARIEAAQMHKGIFNDIFIVVEMLPYRAMLQAHSIAFCHPNGIAKPSSPSSAVPFVVFTPMMSSTAKQKPVVAKRGAGFQVSSLLGSGFRRAQQLGANAIAILVELRRMAHHLGAARPDTYRIACNRERSTTL